MSATKTSEHSALNSVCSKWAINKEIKNQYSSGTFGSFDKLFFFFDPLSKNVHIPNLLEVIVPIYFSFQILLSSYWHVKLSPVDFSSQYGHFFHFILLIFFQWDHRILNSSQFPIVFFVQIIFVGSLILLILLIFIFYKMKRYFQKPFLYIFKFF
jgi:hypothetical protein